MIQFVVSGSLIYKVPEVKTAILSLCEECYEYVDTLFTVLSLWYEKRTNCCTGSLCCYFYCLQISLCVLSCLFVIKLELRSRWYTMAYPRATLLSKIKFDLITTPICPLPNPTWGHNLLIISSRCVELLISLFSLIYYVTIF